MEHANARPFIGTNEKKLSLDQPATKTTTTSQDIHVGNINPTKLARMLQSEFGPGVYQVHVGAISSPAKVASTNKELQMMHNTYSIRAPRILSIVRHLLIFIGEETNSPCRRKLRLADSYSKSSCVSLQGGTRRLLVHILMRTLFQ